MSSVRDKLAFEVLKKWDSDERLKQEFPNVADFYDHERKVVDLAYFRPFREIPDNILTFRGNHNEPNSCNEPA